MTSHSYDIPTLPFVIDNNTARKAKKDIFDFVQSLLIKARIAEKDYNTERIKSFVQK